MFSANNKKEIFQEHSTMVKHIIGQQQIFEKKSYKYLIFLAMLSMTIMLSKGILSYRLVEINGYIMQAGQLIAPFWFILCDIIAEVYGYQIAKKIIYAGLICQIIFAFACAELIQLPFPTFWHDNQAYKLVLGDIWRVSLAVLIALTFSGCINIKLITWWKFLTNGRYFWLRCIGASFISELLFSIFSTFVIQYGRQNIQIIIFIILMSIALKLIYSIVLVTPANIVVFYLKKAENL